MDFIYRLFSPLYGDTLANYLAGYDCAGDKIKGYPDMFIAIGLVAIMVAAVCFVLYYYIINSSKWNKWWHWIMVLLFVGVVNFIIGYEWTIGEYAYIDECFFYITNENNEKIQVIFGTNFWLFGLANCIISALFFIILSFVGKWGSSQCRRTPF